MLTRMLQQAAETNPDKAAIVQGNQRISYAGLAQQAACAASGLRRLGVDRGDCVAVILPNCAEFVASLFACARLGAVMLPLNPHYTRQELQRFLLDSQAGLVVTDMQRSAVCQQIIADSGQAVELVVVGAPDESGQISFDALLKDNELPPPSETLRGRSLYLYTSGSTSAYKRLCCTQENLYYEAHNFVETLGLGADDNILCTVPLHHSYGLGNGLLDAVYCGSTLVLLEPEDAPFVSRTGRILELVKQENIRFFPGVPYQFAALAELPLEVDADLSGIEWCVSSGDVLPRQTYARFLQRFGLAIRSLYGSTEAGSIAINTAPTGQMAFGSLGAPLKNVAIQIRDSQGNTLPEGENGAIWVHSPVIPPGGYDNRAELSAEVFRDGYYDTGDMGRLDQHGHLVLTGRKQTFVNVGGYKVDIGELEEVLQAHPQVREAAALGIEMPSAGQIIKAVVVGDCSEDELLAWCRERLAAYKLPRVIEFRDALPRSPLGKILKKELRETPSISSGIAHLTEALQSASDKTARLAVITGHIQQQVAATLQVEPAQVLATASFNSMGFNSILLVELQNRLIHLTGLALPIMLLWNHPSIAQMAAVIEGKLLASETEVPEETAAGATASNEPLAIIGIGCRFPGGVDNAEAFWQFLLEGGDGVSEIPAARWNLDDFFDADPEAPGKSYSRWGGFLDNVSDFDPAFFAISPREAEQLDPRQRLLLETAWEALEHAACAPASLAGSRTGVFIGHMVGDYHHLLDGNPAQMGAYTSTGVLDSLLANRLSYALDLQGPSLSVDTACSSALTALYLACQNLRQQECDLALVGGVNLMLDPAMHVIGAKAGILSPSGRCRTFSDDADGFVRGEGCGLVVVKRLSDAQRDNDNILAVVRGVAINQDGLTNGIAAPNGLSQQRVIRHALRNAQVDAADITLVETHGTGTLVGDPIEVEALSAVYGAPGAQGDCYLGAVKTNIGHLEGAAGIAGLIKMVLCLQHQTVPPNIHFDALNPHINLDATRLQLPLQAQAWQPKQTERFGAVSSFGIGGTNGHVILQQAPAMTETSPVTERPQHILALSARSPQALLDQAKQYQHWLDQHATANLADVAYTANTGRNHFAWRRAIVSGSIEGLGAQLAAMQAPKQAHTDLPEAKIAFLFTGQGAQYAGMGHTLYATQPYFKQILHACAAMLADELEQPLLQAMQTDLIDQTAYTQPALFALEYALAKLWQAWGVQPAWLIGHSVGEYAAACIAGVFSLQDGLRLIAARGRLMQALEQNGAMLAVRADEAKVAGLIEQSGSGQLSIAALNGPDSLVVSGAKAALHSLASKLKQQGIQTKELVVSHAFHSPLMEPMLEAFRQVAESINYQAPQIGLVSNLTGLPVNEAVTQADYWVQHVRQTVRFADGMQTLEGQGANVFIEVGPKPTLSTMARQFMPDKHNLWLPSLQAGKPDWQQMLGSLGDLYQRGIPIDWVAFDRGYARHKLALPTYPFERQTYWLAAPTNPQRANGALRPLVQQMTRSPRLQETVLQTEFNLDALPYLRDHKVYGEMVVPGATYLATLLSGADVLQQAACQMQDVLFPAVMVLEEGESRTAQVIMTPKANDQAKFELISYANPDAEVQTHMLGNLAWLPPAADNLALKDVQAHCNIPLDPAVFYQTAHTQQIDFGPGFRWIQHLHKSTDGSETLAHLVLPANLDTRGYAFHPALLDACFQVAACTLLDRQEEETWLPFLIRYIQVHRLASGKAWWCHALEKGQHIWDIHLFDADGKLLLGIEGFEERAVPSEALLGKPAWHDWLYQIEWQPTQTATGELAKNWLLFAGQTGLAQQLTDQLADQLVGRGCQVQQVDLTQLQAGSADDYAKLVQSQTGGFGVIHLASLDIANQTDQIEWLNVQTLYLLQALAGSRVESLWFVTQDAQKVLAEDPVTNPAQAALWGMHETLLLEQADLHSVMLDLSGEPDAGWVGRLLEDLSVDPGKTPRETHLAYRAGQRYAARLARYQPAEVAELAFQPDAAYVITGGTGGLGLHIASWMVGQGARHLVLLARHEPGEIAQAKINALRAPDVDIQVLAADVADWASLEAAMATLSRPVKGIIHAAGVLDDSTIAQQNAERFHRVMQPKVQGACNLDRLGRELPLDLFVLFSSMTAVTGTVGQANYGAANAYMDALAHYRHSQGLPALSINWGGWAEIGMAAQMDQAMLNRLAAHGESLISPAQGTEILATLLQQNQAQLAVLPVDWAKYLPATGSQADAFFAQLAAKPDVQGQSEAVQTSWVKMLKEAPEEQKYELLLQNLRNLLAQAIGLPSAEKVGLRQGLRDLGLDSILSIEVRSKLEDELDIALPATLLFDYPTVETLAGYLSQNFLDIAPPKATQTSQEAMPPDDDLSDLLADIEQISDADIQQQLGGK